MENFKGIEVSGSRWKEMIVYLETLDQEYLDNLHSCNASKGYCEFLWHDINKKHIPNNEGIEIPICEYYPHGDYWGTESKFLNPKLKTKRYVTDISRVHEATKFSILLEQLKGESLSNAIVYWCDANNISIDIEDDAIYKAIDQKADELLKILKPWHL